MKKKQLKTVGLLVIVVIIWGYLIYKVIVSINSDGSSTTVQDQQISYERNTEEVTQEKFDLHIPKRDPFLDVVLVKPEPKKTPARKETIKNTVDLDMIWSNIAYKGTIAKKSTDQYLYLINIKGKEVILRPEQSYQEYKLIKASNENVTLKYKRFTKTFPVSRSF